MNQSKHAEGGSDRICLRHQLMPGIPIGDSHHYASCHQTVSNVAVKATKELLGSRSTNDKEVYGLKRQLRSELLRDSASQHYASR
jgi:hypothetical protein